MGVLSGSGVDAALVISGQQMAIERRAVVAFVYLWVTSLHLMDIWGFWEYNSSSIDRRIYCNLSKSTQSAATCWNGAIDGSLEHAGNKWAGVDLTGHRAFSR